MGRIPSDLSQAALLGYSVTIITCIREDREVTAVPANSSADERSSASETECDSRQSTPRRASRRYEYLKDDSARRGKKQNSIDLPRYENKSTTAESGGRAMMPFPSAKRILKRSPSPSRSSAHVESDGENAIILPRISSREIRGDGSMYWL